MGVWEATVEHQFFCAPSLRPLAAQQPSPTPCSPLLLTPHPCCLPAQVLKLEAEPLTDAILRLKIKDAHAQRWEVPQWLLQSELLPGGSQRRQAGTASKGASASGAGAPQYPQYKLAVKQEPFSLEVARPEEGQTLFNTTGLRLVFKASPGPSSAGQEPQPGTRGWQPVGCRHCLQQLQSPGGEVSPRPCLAAS